MSLICESEVGCIATVHGQILSVGLDNMISFKVSKVTYTHSRPQIGDLVKHKGKICRITRYWNNCTQPSVEGYGDTYWDNIYPLTDEELKEVEEEKTKTQNVNWKKQADAIPVDVLLESIKERVK